MDPVSQAIVGSTAAQTVSSRRKIVAFSLLGAAAGMAPDLDILIRSDADPLLFLKYHRQFTHSLVFIPFGALLVAMVLHWPFRRTLRFRESWLACLLGYATHGLLDACTSYGTQLFWPFSDHRVSWNVVSVIDPIFTLPVLFFVLLAGVRKRRAFTVAAVAWTVGYLLLGLAQQERASVAAERSAREQGHEPARLSVKPAFGNIVLWKVIYEHEGYYHVNAVRTLRDVRWCPGTRIEELDVARQLPELHPSTQQARDIERFRWFSKDYLALRAGDDLIMDIRYSTVPNEVEPLWGVRIDRSAPDTRVEWWARRDTDARQRAQMRALLAGEGCAPLPRSQDARAASGANRLK
ncbi:MAG: metal-dependent hydrolase [Gammaproteobacteria bacterium]|nr:metal-dependent hydrolase [Gammaproteobacteria bacterium]